LAYADDVNLLGDNVEGIKRNTENLIVSSKEDGVEISVEETKFMSVFPTRMEVKIRT
jgi:hypothetical protein